MRVMTLLTAYLGNSDRRAKVLLGSLDMADLKDLTVLY